MSRGWRQWLGSVWRSMTAQAGLREWAAMIYRDGGESPQVTRPYSQSATVYAGIRPIAETVAGLRMTLHATGDPEAVRTSGLAWRLLNEPLPGVTWQQFAAEIIGHLVEGGEAHLFDPLRIAGAAGDSPGQLLVVGARQMRPVTSGSLLAAWEYRPQGWGGIRAVTLPAEDVYSLKLFNPYDPLRGLSPLAAAAHDIRQSYLATIYNAAALSNGGSPGGVYTHPGNPSDEERAELRRALMERHSGPTNANRPMFLWGGATYAQTALKNTDLELNATRRLSREEILSVLGTPPVLAGIYESAHYDVADQAIRIFMLHRVAPLARSVEALFNRLVLPRVEPGVELSLDIYDHPAMVALLQQRVEAAQRLCDLGVPYNEAIAVLRLPLAPQPWGDRSVVPAGRTSVDDVVAGMQAPPEAPTPETEAARIGPRRRLSARNAAAMQADRRREEAYIRRAAASLGRRFAAWMRGWRRGLLARLRREASDRQRAAGDRQRGADETVIQRIVLNLRVDQEALRRIIREEWPAQGQRVMRDELARLGLPADRIEELVHGILGGRAYQALGRHKELRITSIERTLRERVARSLREGFEAGEDRDALAQRVHEVAGETQTRAWSQRIGRNEAGQVVSSGRWFAARAAGTRGKGWLTGANPRPTHAQAGRDYPAARAIGIEEDFVVGGERLSYPRDPRGSAAEIVNCNCVMVTARPAPRDEDQAAWAAA